MKKLLEKFEQKPPEVIFEWNDQYTEAKGWVVINSLRGGAAGGGTRMRIGLDKNEVVALAKTMEVKFTISGPDIGGAKSGIDFDPNDPRKDDVLKRWFKVVTPLLKSYYGTGGDLNIDEVHDVIRITEEFGLWHPQEGIVSGHLQANDPQKIKKLGQLRQGVVKVVEDFHYTPDITRKYTVSDLITGYGVAESVKHYYLLWGGDIASKRAIIQGWGNVGSAAAYYLSSMGVRIVGIIDKAGGIIKKEGLSFDEIKQLYLNKKGNSLNSDEMLSYADVNNQIWSLGAEIFIPAASSRLVTSNQAKLMVKNGTEVISCGANVPFNDPEIFFGPTSEYVDNNLALIPDFIANCGMARVFAYLMGTGIEMTDNALFNDVSLTIEKALTDVHVKNQKNKKIAQYGFELALSKLTAN